MAVSTMKGFSLIELAIVLTIMALVIGGGLVTSTNLMESRKIEVTHDRIAYILQAVDDFRDNGTVNSTAYIPCPSGGDLTFGDNNFGFDRQVSGNCVATAGVLMGNNMVMGAVPVYTLNIPVEYALDGWNRRFTYVVDDAVVASDGSDSANIGRIRIDNSNGTTALTSVAAVVVISHGANGFGAWGGRGGPQVDIGSGGADESDNDDVTINNVFVQSLPVASFDDIVAYRTIWQLDGTE